MRAVLAGLLVAGLCAIAVPAASATPIVPRSAGAFHDSIGVVTHIVYFDTSYGDWPRAVARLDELGVRHLREGVYANPSPRWRDWNERYYRAVELAAARGMRFTFGINPPGSETGTLDQILDVVGGRLRGTAEALEAPNEMDKYVGGLRWPRLLSTYGRELRRKAKVRPTTRTLPILGPSFATPDGPTRAGDQRAWLDVGNIHPYTGGLSPDPRHIREELQRAGVTARGKPVWATEAGFHNALRASADDQPGVSEQAAAVYLLRTFLEHYRAGIRRTYAYELIDEKPDPTGRDAEQHFGLLRNDFSRKPAFVALRNLLSAVEDPGGVPALRPLRLRVSRPDSEVRRLVLQKSDGSYVVALWRLASVWDRERGRALDVSPWRVTVRLPSTARVTLADPVRSAERRRLGVRRGAVGLKLGARPLLLHVVNR
jgi:hypothetical protein